MKIKLDLNKDSCEELQKRLDDYAKTLKNNIYLFTDKLAEVGIQAAMMNTGKYANHIVFQKEFTFTDGTTKCMLIAIGENIEKVWVVKDGVHSETINTLLMAEFGSGWQATTGAWSRTFPFGGQGTLNKYGHANDPNGWWWSDETGTHHSYGEAPSYPMYSAYVEMKTQIRNIAKEVFKC